MKRNYFLLLCSQFLSAFGDNAILAVILGPLIFQEKNGTISQEELQKMNAIFTSILFVPYILLAPLAGYLNDRYPKSRWLMGGNAVKMVGALLCLVGFMHGHLWKGLGYFIVGIGSCLYSPAKYGILPEILPRERLVKANGTVELLTLVAILGGFIAGSALIDRLPELTCYTLVALIFAASLILTLFMSRTPEYPQVRLGPSVGEFARHFRDLLQSPRLSRVLLGTGIFWVVGATMKMNFQPWGSKILGLENNTQVSLLSVWVALGVMGGSVLAGKLHRTGDLRRTRPYGWAMAAFTLLLAAVEVIPVLRETRLTLPNGLQLFPLVVVLLAASGAFAGLFLIPLNAALQAESDQSKLGKTIAAQNFVDNFGMVFGGLFVLGAAHAGLNASGVFLQLALLIALLVACLRVPPAPALPRSGVPSAGGADQPATREP